MFKKLEQVIDGKPCKLFIKIRKNGNSPTLPCGITVFFSRNGYPFQRETLQGPCEEALQTAQKVYLELKNMVVTAYKGSNVDLVGIIAFFDDFEKQVF